MVTLGSRVTPQVITALVPLMTLWSCGALVMRVRAVDTERTGFVLCMKCLFTLDAVFGKVKFNSCSENKQQESQITLSLTSG